MNMQAPSKIVVWAVLAGICVVAALTDCMIDLLQLDIFCTFCCLVLLFLLGLPVALGFVGGRRQNLWLTLCGVPAILVSFHVGEFLWSQARGVTPPPSLMPDAEQFWFYCGTGLLMLMPAVITHGVVQARYNKRVPHGQCLRCGYNLTGNVSGTCPECGMAIAKEDTA